MTIDEPPRKATVLHDSGWRRAGAIAALALGIGYIVIFFLYARVGVPPTTGEAWFDYLPGKTTAWWAILAVSVFTDFLFIPVTLALFLALSKVNRIAMVVATAFSALFIVLDLSVTWTHYASILILYGRYASAASDARRASLLAAADYASALLLSPLEVAYAIVTLSLGILVTALVMLQARLSKITAWLGVSTGILGIASLTGLGPAIIGNALFATAWLFAVAKMLYSSDPRSSAFIRGR
ncbi:MAG TPA: hypothetical protein VFA04_05750 [Bryobacteraceae bacterium]|nr:hypothetical protein [Bryobacteraceae bacterium]